MKVDYYAYTHTPTFTCTYFKMGKRCIDKDIQARSLAKNRPLNKVAGR